MSAGSNLGRVSRIGRSMAFGAWAAALRRRSYAPRRRPAGEGEPGAAGLGLGRGLAGGVARGMRNALVALGGAGGRSWQRWLYGGGSARRLPPASEVLSARVAYDL